MKKIAFFIVGYLMTGYSSLFAQCPSGLSGAYSIGPTGNYTSLTAAITALKISGVNNPVILELQPAYTSGSEITPLNFKNIPCIDSIRSVTIRPATGASNLFITSASTIATVNLDSARFIHFDGRPEGTGTSKQLTISNISTGGAAIRFINDASWNHFEYLNILGVNSSQTGGVITFLTSNQSITNGNNNNRISNCSITKGTANPVNCIYALGSANKKNSNNEIVDCTISDFYAGSGNTNGIYIGANNSGWRLSGNSVYHSVQRTFNTNAALVAAIYINDTTSSGFTIENNFIGGTAPNCGGSAITYGVFYNAIQLMVGNSSYTSVQNNTIANLNFDIILSGPQNNAILLEMGKFKCGDIAGNTIGSQSSTNSITIRVGTFFTFNAIAVGTQDLVNSGADTCYIKNNLIGGIYAYLAPSTFIAGNIRGIVALNQKKGYLDISGNTIGSPSVFSSIANDSYTGSGNECDGILAETYSTVPVAQWPNNLISNNVITNLRGQPFGIRVKRGNFRVLNNQVHHLYGIQSSEWGLTVRGIMCEAGNETTVVSGNTIHSLTSPNTNSVNDVAGIDVRNSPGALIAKNNIHSIQSNIASGNNLNGIYISSPGQLFIINNMIRMGMDTSGNPVGGNQKIFGIYLLCDSAYMAHNSVYIGASGTGESAALMIPAGMANPGTIINNIFTNKRSATLGSPRYHYAIRIDEPTAKLSKVDFNLYYASGTNAYLGIFKNIIHSAIATWRTATLTDSSSIFYDPNFVNPEGNAATGDLHLSGTTPAESSGTNASFAGDDIDNEDRSLLTPVDIGADAGNFTMIDVNTPILTHTSFFGQQVNSSYTYFVRIRDGGSGVDTIGNNKPRMWFRKKYPAVSNWTSVEGTLSSGTVKDGNWGFTPDYVAAGISAGIGDSIEYYFVAQDKFLNLGYSNITGTSHINVYTQTAAPSSPLRLLIYGVFPDTVYVGIGQQYPSLTNEGGFFQAGRSSLFLPTQLNASVVITSDLNETGTYGYTPANADAPAIRIFTNSAVEKLIKNVVDLSVPMIVLSNTNKLTIDGSVNGSGRYLRFTNSHSNAALCESAVRINGKAYDLTIKNCIFESNSTKSGVHVMYLAGSDMRRTRIEGNLLRNIEPGSPGTAGLPASCLAINCDGATITDPLLIKNNEIINFGYRGIYVFRTLTQPSGGITIDSNHFYHNSSLEASSSKTVIEVSANLLQCSVTNNFIGGSSKACGGNPWSFNTAASNAYFTGLYLHTDDDSTKASSAQGNTIQNIRFNNTGYYLTGIYMDKGSINAGNLQGNLVGSLTDDSSIVNLGIVSGITGYVSLNDVITINPYLRIENNIVAGIAASYVEGMRMETKRGLFRNNKITGIRLSGTNPTGFHGYVATKFSLRKGVIDKNEISNIISSNTSSTIATGMELVYNGTEPDVVVSKNKIFGLESSTAAGGLISGIYSTSGGIFNFQNNRINLTNGTHTDPVEIRGFNLVGNTSTRRATLYYNTVRIGGSVSSGSSKSYAIATTQSLAIGFFRNNLLYNERTGGSGLHLALANLSGSNLFPPESAWPANNSNNNLFITADTSYVNEWRGNGAVSLSQWRTLSQGDNASYTNTFSNVPSDHLFVLPATGDLSINTSEPVCWYANGKGIPVYNIADDFDSINVRSTSVLTGATDIGSDEFNTATAPPAGRIAGNHTNSGTEDIIFNNRRLASITWGPGGILPVLGEPKIYSGKWPNDMTNGSSVSNARAMNTWLDIPVTGGSGYSYSITLFYDSSMLGKIQDVSQMVLHKRKAGEDGSWQMLLPTQVNNVTRSATVNGLSSFSEFTGAESGAPLALPGSIICPNGATSYKSNITGAGYTYQWQVNTGTGFADLANNTIYSGVTDSILTITTPPSTYNRYQYRCVTNTGSGTINSISFLLKIASSWTGELDTDWTNPLNWSCGQIPDANTDVFIKSGLSTYPVLTTNITCRSIIVSSGSVIQVNSGVTVQLTGK